MTVKVTTKEILNRPAGATRFSDDFNRAATTLGVGEEYISGPLPSVIEAVGCTIFTNGTTFCMRATSVNANQRNSIVFYPKPVIPFVTGNQFAQCLLAADDSVSGTGVVAGGLFLLSGWQAGNGGYRDYSVWWEGPTGGANQNSLRLRRMTAPSTEVQLGTTATGTAVIGQTLRIEARLNVGSNDVECFIDGVSVLAVNDNSATRPLIGNPGIGRLLWNSTAVPGTRTQQLDDFLCGSL